MLQIQRVIPYFQSMAMCLLVFPLKVSEGLLFANSFVWCENQRLQVHKLHGFISFPIEIVQRTRPFILFLLQFLKSGTYVF